MKILVGTIEIGRSAWDMADGLRAHGHEVHTVMSWLNQQHPDLRYTDPNFHPDSLLALIQALNEQPLGVVLSHFPGINRLHQLFTYFDLYVFQFGGSLLPLNIDLHILKQLGKKVVSIFNGDDVRHWSAALPVMESFGLTLPAIYLEEPKRSTDSAVERIRRYRMAESYADVVYSDKNFSSLAVRPYSQRYIVVNRALYKPKVPGRDVPVIVHAPSVRGVKSTDIILDVLRQLEQEGARFELRLVEGKSNREVIEMLSDADVLVDQLEWPLYGMLALEGLASGCAVLGGNLPEFEPLPRDRPLLHVDRRNIYSQLRRIITDKNLRVALGNAGPGFIEQTHDHIRVAGDLIQHVLSPDGPALDHYPTFFARRYQLPSYETMPDDVKVLTAEIMQQWGAPRDIDPRNLIERNLVPGDFQQRSIPRWSAHTDSKQGDWGPYGEERRNCV